MKNNNKPKSVSTIARYRIAEGALDESRKLYEDLVTNQSAGIYRMLVQKQENGKSIIESASMEYVSDRFCDHFEVEKAGFLKNAIVEAFSKIHPDDIHDFVISNEIAQQSLEPYIRETRLLIGDRIKWLRFESSPRKLENGSTRWTGVTIDITKQKLDEEALKRKISELEIYYELAITREHKMIALKSEINLLLQRAGEKAKY